MELVNYRNNNPEFGQKVPILRNLWVTGPELGVFRLEKRRLWRDKSLIHCCLILLYLLFPALLGDVWLPLLLWNKVETRKNVRYLFFFFLFFLNCPSHMLLECGGALPELLLLIFRLEPKLGELWPTTEWHILQRHCDPMHFFCCYQAGTVCTEPVPLQHLCVC